jgi:hypothetical protein
MTRRVLIGLAAIVLIGAASGSEPPSRVRTYRAYCRHASHGRQVWVTSAYTSIAPAWMVARKHNEANPAHDAAVATLRGAEPVRGLERR